MKKDQRQGINKWKSADHVNTYFSIVKNRPHNKEITTVLLEQIPPNVSNVLDLGTGYGILLELVKQKNPKAKGVALDFFRSNAKISKKKI